MNDDWLLQKYLEMEDAVEGEKKDLQDKVESLESIVRMLELKSRNSADHGKSSVKCVWMYMYVCVLNS